jgi:hypothetical protein
MERYLSRNTLRSDPSSSVSSDKRGGYTPTQPQSGRGVLHSETRCVLHNRISCCVCYSTAAARKEGARIKTQVSTTSQDTIVDIAAEVGFGLVERCNSVVCRERSIAKRQNGRAIRTIRDGFKTIARTRLIQRRKQAITAVSHDRPTMPEPPPSSLQGKRYVAQIQFGAPAQVLCQSMAHARQC